MAVTEFLPFKIPNEIQNKIEALLQLHSCSLQDSKKIANCVLKLSDFYISNPQGTSPWEQDWAQIAYLSYYLPLNYIRCRAVLHEAEQRKFFNGLSKVIEFGSGNGALSLAMEDVFTWEKYYCLEISENAKKQHKSIQNIDSIDFVKSVVDIKNIKNENTLSAFSYSFTELEELPNWAKSTEGLLIIEPSTQDDGRRLMKLREQLLSENYEILAPCSHSMTCPLLHKSTKDWCHDRVHWQMPEWFKKIEDLIPIKNRTLSFSYLLARKSLSANYQAESARIVGDPLVERGKVKQMICRSDQREFLAWFSKRQEVPSLHRGDLVLLPRDIQIKSNELRSKEEITLLLSRFWEIQK